MEQERINLSSQRERDRLRVLHELEQGHLPQREAARRLRLSDRQMRRLQTRWRQEGDGGPTPLLAEVRNLESPIAMDFGRGLL